MILYLFAVINMYMINVVKKYYDNILSMILAVDRNFNLTRHSTYHFNVHQGPTRANPVLFELRHGAYEIHEVQDEYPTSFDHPLWIIVKQKNPPIQVYFKDVSPTQAPSTFFRTCLKSKRLLYCLTIVFGVLWFLHYTRIVKIA